jgi:hypothetical protein
VDGKFSGAATLLGWKLKPFNGRRRALRKLVCMPIQDTVGRHGRWFAGNEINTPFNGTGLAPIWKGQNTARAVALVFSI